MFTIKKYTLNLIFIANTVLLASCSSLANLGATATPVPPTFTPAPPTATPVPMAVLVNGEGISVDEYQAELLRYKNAQAALGLTVTDESGAQVVIDELIGQLLLAQGAQQNGFVVDDALINQRVDDLAASLGGMEALTQWQTAHGYDDASFRVALKRQIASAWMRDTLANAVPKEAEQIHLQQILVYTQEAAQSVMDFLNGGRDFGELAALYDPNTRGDLSWFPRGYLLEPAIEEKAFSMNVGEVSAIIESGAGWHVIKVLARETRLLSPDALLILQLKAVQDWVVQMRQQSTIVLAP